MKKLAIISILTFSFLANAERFENHFIEFELPTGWECRMEGTEYICQSSIKDRQAEAIIIFAAKKRGEKDSLDFYQKYLRARKTYKLPGGKVQVSDEKTTSRRKINGHDWIDSLHLSSEIPGFYTRYLATVKEDLGIALTYSVSRENYNNYKDLFEKMISSIRVFRKRSAEYDKKLAMKSGSDKPLIGETDFVDPAEHIDLARKRSKKAEDNGQSGSNDTIFYVIAGAIVLALLILKRRRS